MAEESKLETQPNAKKGEKRRGLTLRWGRGTRRTYFNIKC